MFNCGHKAQFQSPTQDMAGTVLPNRLIQKTHKNWMTTNFSPHRSTTLVNLTNRAPSAPNPSHSLTDPHTLTNPPWPRTCHLKFARLSPPVFSLSHGCLCNGDCSCTMPRCATLWGESPTKGKTATSSAVVLTAAAVPQLGGPAGQNASKTGSVHRLSVAGAAVLTAVSVSRAAVQQLVCRTAYHGLYGLKMIMSRTRRGR